MGKDSPCFTNRKLGSELATAFRGKKCHRGLSLLCTELVRWQQSGKADEALGSVGKGLEKNKSTSMLLYKPVVCSCLTAVCS